MKKLNLTKVNVLVVERHLFIRQLMRDVLRALGVHNVALSYADELFDDTSMENPPDMIFTDWSPGLDGVDLIKSIRRNQANLDRFIPVVVISAFTDLEHVCQARDAGMTEFLAKPVTGANIYRRICSLVEHPRNFIETEIFFGPDRRRRVLDFGGGEQRAQPPIAQPSTERVQERALH
jgi:DNA-binding response OmpR family regulator